MTTYRMEDGTILKTENAVQSWDEKKDWNGSNKISRATGNQWGHETLHKSRKGRYWVEHDSLWGDSLPWASWISKREAAAWLLLMEHEVPEDLQEHLEQVEE